MASNNTIVPAFLAGWLQLLVPGDCFEEFFVKFNFLHVPCLKMFISKCLGYAIISGSCIGSWCSDIPWITLSHHPLIYNPKENETVTYNVDEFFETVVSAASKVFTAKRPNETLKVIEGPIRIESYASPASLVFNQSGIGYFRDRNVKVPQIIKIWNAKSGQGINLLSVTLELLAISATWAYGSGHKFPFSSYGEALFLAAQTSFIAFLVLYYEGRMSTGLVYLSVYVGLMGFLLSPAAPMGLLTVLQAGNIVMTSVSKCIQAWENFKNSSTGQLSLVTVYMLFLGSCARIFTSIQETGDIMVIASYIVSSFCNGVIAVQLIYYWNSPNGQHKGVSNKKTS